jgi:hypothetical protein
VGVGFSLIDRCKFYPLELLLMNLKLMLLLPAMLLTGCSLYPFGHSQNGSYFGGQGNAYAPRTYIPKGVQRQEPMLSLEFKSPK